MTQPIYETWAYEVRPNESLVGYHLFNKLTQVNEGGSEKLASAINQCDIHTELISEVIERMREANNEASL